MEIFYGGKVSSQKSSSNFNFSYFIPIRSRLNGIKLLRQLNRVRLKLLTHEIGNIMYCGLRTKLQKFPEGHSRSRSPTLILRQLQLI